MKIKKKELLILFIVFILMLLLNSLTPYLLDDYFYSLKFNSTERIHNLCDIFIFQKEHYMNWGGRVLAHSIAQVFLLLPKFIFNVFNSIIFVLQGFLIYKIVYHKENNYYMLSLIYLILWFVNPIFGQINFWLIGSCNYLWTMTIILFYIYIFENYKNATLYKILIIVFGLLSGMCNENTSLAVIVMLTYYYFFVDDKKNKFKFISIIFCIFGYLSLLLAPGNFVRATGQVDNINQVIFHFNSLFIFLLIPFAIFLILVFYYNIKKKDKKLITYYIASIICLFSLVVVPEIFIRNFYSAFVFSLLILICIIKSFSKKLVHFITIVLLFVFCFEYIFTFYEYFYFNSFYKQRDSILVKAEKSKQKSIVLEKYHSSNSKIPISVDLPDLSYDSKEFPNNVLERYYGVDEIVGKWK